METSTPPGSRYEIRLSGQIDGRWTDWFGGFSVRRGGGGTTVITGGVPDQAALHGVLSRIRDLGMPLLSVTRLDHGSFRASDPSPDQPLEAS